jgi:Na+-translocating ferredoxin:NAD+ oxidoreductase RnfG subunit
MSEEANVNRRAGALLRGVIVLACICLGSGAGVGVLYYEMKDEIEAKAQSVFLEKLGVVLGEAEDYPAVGEYPEGTPPEQKVYVSPASDPVLYAAMGTAQGYQSQLKVLVSVRASAPGTPLAQDPVVHALAVVESQETPGLGENIRAVEKDVSVWARIAGAESTPGRPWFQEQFGGKRLSDLVVEKRADTDRILPVTGATVSSRATVEAARAAVEEAVRRTSEVYGP